MNICSHDDVDAPIVLEDDRSDTELVTATSDDDDRNLEATSLPDGNDHISVPAVAAKPVANGQAEGSAIKVEGSSDSYVQLDDPNFQPMLTRLRVAIKIPPEEAIYPFLDEKTRIRTAQSVIPLNIRSLREYIDDPNNPCLVFEWMDNTLWETKDEPMEHKVGIFKIVVKSCLLGLLAVQKMNSHNQYCHAGEASVSR